MTREQIQPVSFYSCRNILAEQVTPCFYLTLWWTWHLKTEIFLSRRDLLSCC